MTEAKITFLVNDSNFGWQPVERKLSGKNRRDVRSRINAARITLAADLKRAVAPLAKNEHPHIEWIKG